MTPWTVARQTPLSMGFPRQQYWSGLPFPTPGDLSDPGIKPPSLESPALAGRFFTTVPPGKSNFLGACSHLPVNLGLSDPFLKAILGELEGPGTCKSGQAGGEGQGQGTGHFDNLRTTRHCQHFFLFLASTGCQELLVHTITPLREIF